jgi:CBS domain containing-hemolysin-like protein
MNEHEAEHEEVHKHIHEHGNEQMPTRIKVVHTLLLLFAACAVAGIFSAMVVATTMIERLERRDAARRVANAEIARIQGENETLAKLLNATQDSIAIQGGAIETVEKLLLVRNLTDALAKGNLSPAEKEKILGDLHTLLNANPAKN